MFLLRRALLFVLYPAILALGVIKRQTLMSALALPCVGVLYAELKHNCQYSPFLPLEESPPSTVT